MTKPRIPETNTGIQGQPTVAAYDEMQRHLLSKGWIRTQALLNQGMICGHALEIGPGPGYLGLEWLKHTDGTTLTGLDISPDMIALATRNAETYGFSGRVAYRLGSGDLLPFEDGSFDLVFSNGSLHEWKNPGRTFDEIWRVLKPGGRYLISDLRRDMSWFIKRFMWSGTRPVSIRPGLLSSIAAAYTPAELRLMLASTSLKDGRVDGNPFGVTTVGDKSET
jgi:ubiquinone/menaquinone biosynthesis C-methylase UbiE